MAFSRGFSALLAAAALFAVTAIVVRERVVAVAPHSAAVFTALGLPVNLDRLVVGPVKATLRLENDLRTLLVESEISNPRHTAQNLPQLRVSIRDASGATLYTWTTSAGAKAIAPGGRVPVRARLTAPPLGQDVVVEFAHSPA